MKFCGILTLAAIVAVTACGKAKDSSSGSDTTDSVTNDTDLQDGVVSNQIEEATASLVDDASAGSSFAAIAPAADVSFSRTCEADSTTGGATVNVTASGSASSTFSTTRINLTRAVNISGTEARKWSKASAGSAIQCKSSTSHIKLDWSDAANIDGLKLDVTTARSKIRTQEGTIKRKGVTTNIKTSESASVSGTRSITYSNAASTSSQVSFTKSIVSNVTRKFDVTRADDSVASLESAVTTKSDAPLVVDVVRVKSTGAWSSKTVKSGTLVATQKDGTRVESTFSNVEYSASATNKCIPISGSILGSIYAKDATTASTTFTVTFTADGATKTVGTDDPTDITLDGKSCDLASEN